jgi:hypothetical protein
MSAVGSTRLFTRSGSSLTTRWMFDASFTRVQEQSGLWDTRVRRESSDTPASSLMHRDLPAARNLQSVRYGAMGHTRRFRKRLQDAARPSRHEIRLPPES